MNDAPLVATLGLPLALAVIMCALGLSLTPGDFKRVLVFPKGVGIGLANLLVLSPLLAFAIAEAFGLAPELAVGLVLMGSAPGGTMANLLTHLARGDTALSVTMTAVSSIAAVVTVPLYLGLSIDWFDAPVGDDVSIFGVVARVFAITIVPLAVGMALRARDPERAKRLEPRIKRVALGVFVLVVAGAIVSELDIIGENFAELALATLTLNVAAMALSYSIARAARLPDGQSTAIGLELGVHNSTLAIAVATSIATVLATPAAVYSLFMFFTAGLFARAMYRRNGPVEAAPAAGTSTAAG